MADPDGYEPQYDFSAYQATNPKRPLPGHELDVELHDISNAMGSTQDALADIRRSDGRLQNGIVDADAIGPTAVGALIEQSTELMEDVLFVVEMYLGQMAEDPETGRDGADLEPSNWYYNTVTGGYRYYTADGWRPMTGVAAIRQYRFIMEAGQTEISGLDENGFQYFASGESVAVFKNGAILPKTTGFTTPDNSTITLASAASDGDVVVVLSFEEAVPAELGRLARRLHVADGTTATFALPTGVTSIGQVLSVAVDGVAQNYDTYSMVGSGLVLDAMPRNGERVQITAWTAVLAEDSNTRRAYAFASRADFIAALGWPWASGAVLSDGTVQYEYIGTGTAISDMPGWVPFGSIYPEHWAKCGWLNGEATPTADDAIPMKTALDYATALRLALKLIGGKNYRLRSTLVCNASFACIESDSFRQPTLWTDAGVGVGIDVFPVDPDLSATSNLSSIRFSNFIMYPHGVNTADIGIRLRRVTGCYTEGLTLGGYFNAIKEMNCRNVHHERMVGSDFNLDPSVTGAAWYYRTGMLLDGATWAGGFTTRFNSLIGGGDLYDAFIQVGHSDVMQYNHCYLGATKRHVLLKPDHPTAIVGGQSFSQVYFDGVQNLNNCDCIVVDGNTYTAARMSRIVFSLCVFGQAQRAFVASNGADLRFVSFSNCTLQNMDWNAIFIDSDVGPELDFNISGGYIDRWGLVSGGDANKEFAGRILKARSVTIDGVTINADGSNRIPFRFEGITSLAYNGNNHLTTGTMYTQSGVTERVAQANVGTGVFSENTENISSGTTPNPTLKFGGTLITDLGGTYSSRSINWYRNGDMITVNGNVSLSAKGTATGVASITLPVAPFASQGVVMGFIRPTNMTADAAVPAYVLYIPSGGTELFIRKYGTTGAPVANELSDTAFTNTTSINFTITYRVA